MKQFILALTLIALTQQISVAQQAMTNPVKWSFEAEKVGESKYLLKFTANMSKGWVVYSQHIEEGGPIPTGFFFDESSKVDLIGNVEEKSKAIKSMDELFGMEVIKFKEVAQFEQLVEAKSIPGIVKGELEFMTCDGNQCLPPTVVDFSFDLN